MTYISNAAWKRCTACGECLVKCPVLKMDRDEAAASIKKLIRGEEVPRVMEECTYCFNCNRYCPVDGLRPHELILQRTLEKRQNVPAVFRYLSNGMGTPNLFQDIYRQLTPSENRVLDRWEEPPGPAREILWVGCVGKISCLDIEHSRVLSPLPKFGPRDLCCGELAYRLGSFENYRKTIERTLARFEALEIERMVCYCGSCYNYFSSILPRVYGKTLPFKLISMYQWMWERIRKEEIKLQKPLAFRAAVHESCYVSELEPDFAETLRKLYRASGAEIQELMHHGDKNLSCGAVSVVRNLNLFKSMVKVQRRKYEEIKNTGTHEVAVNCPGCFITMAFSSRFFGVKLRYMPDELLAAYGDTVSIPLQNRLPLFVKAFVKKAPALATGSV